MAITLNEIDWVEICDIAQRQGEIVYQQTPVGVRLNLPRRFGKGGEQTISLRDGLVLSIREGSLQEDLSLKRHHEYSFPLVSKFILTGSSRVNTANVPGVASVYEEVAGWHYLYCLPELTEVEEWYAKEPIQVVMIAADLDYFKQFEHTHTLLPIPLRKLLEATSIQPFHQSLGRATAAMMQVVKQLMNCPYQGLMQQLYLEGKSLELLALQFAEWAEPQAIKNSPIRLNANDVEYLYAAKEILIQRVNNPPSLMELARQVGLNDRKLKQGFLQVFGTTVFGYLRDYRLERSQQLLASGEMSVTEVAHVVGYASLPSFSKAFRKKFGNSPIVYLNRHSVKKIHLG